MAKKLLHNYTFDASAQTIEIQGVHSLDRFLMITNVTSNQVIFIFNQADVGAAGHSINTVAETTTLTLAFDTTSMNDTDTLQIFIEEDFQSFAPDESYTDPVSKFRVSTPANLIDTDFEYGLQSTKWETLELVNNIPTFFSRNGDTDLPIEAINVVAGSTTIQVETRDPHGLVQGNPIIVQGTKVRIANGAFVVTKIIDDNNFEYVSKSTSAKSENILDDYTQVFLGSVYQGTEFKLSNINGITTDAGSPSTLTVSTAYPLGFKAGTSFFLTNSVGQKIVNFDAADTTFENFANIGQSRLANDPTGETDDWALGLYYSPNWKPMDAKFFKAGDPADMSVNTSSGNESITFTTAHGFDDGQQVVYFHGEGNGVIGGLTDCRPYWVRKIDDFSFYLTTGGKASTNRVNLTNSGTSNGCYRSAFVKSYDPITVRTGSSDETIEFDGLVTNVNDPQQVFMATYTTVGSLSLITNSDSLSDYTTSSAQIVYAKNPTTNGSGNTVTQFSTNPNGSTINQRSTGTGGGLVRMEPATLANTLFFPDHGLQTNDVVYFESTGTPPTSDDYYYRVTVVNNDRFRIRRYNQTSDRQLTSVGTTSANVSISGFSYRDGADTIVAAGHGLSNGDTVVYADQGGTTINGLTNGLTYFVSQATTDTMQMSTTASGLETPNITIANRVSGNNTTGYVYTNYQYIRKNAHGFTNGDRILYTSSNPLGGMRNNAFYYINVIDANRFYVHRTATGAVAGTVSDRIWFSYPMSGSSRFRKTSIVDLYGAGTGTQRLTANVDGASDGVLEISNVIDDNTFECASSAEIPTRTIQFDPDSSVWIEDDAIRIPDHYFRTGYQVNLTSVGTVPGGLTAGNDYYVIRVSRNWIRLAATEGDSLAETAISLTSKGSGLATLSTSNIIGEVLGAGTARIELDSDILIGTDTNFTSFFKTGDTISLYKPEDFTARDGTNVNTTNDTIDTTVNHGWTTGDAILMEADTAPGGLTSGFIYYVSVVDNNTISLYPTNADAVADTNKLDITSAGAGITMHKINNAGATIEQRVSGVLSQEKMQLDEVSDEALADLEYSVSTSLLIRSDGFALHRPYDGGVELIPSSNPDSQMIRQTRRYFRYQSGKGIQVSFAVNFSPTTQIERIETTGTKVATVFTKFPHRMTQGLSFHIYDAPLENGEDYFNGDWEVVSILDDYSFTFEMPEADFFCEISGTTMTVSSMTSGLILPGMTLNTTPASKVVSQTSGTDGEDGVYEIDTALTVAAGTAVVGTIYSPNAVSTGSFAEYYVNNWNNSSLRCGLFDDQNGMFFEYDGQQLSVCRRSSTKQLSGVVTTEFAQGIVQGTNTKFISQVNAGDYIVIRGQSCLVTKVENDTTLYIAPSYRGVSANNVIVTKTEIERVPQSQWNIDKCDGTGKTGYVLDIHKIQMAYMDYSWYGAGKVRFGFKDQNGNVKYFHSFIHNNKKTEAYLRSGNLPARYDIQNIGQPSYVPALAHWGTSVIMDGEFNDDKAYIFNASSNTINVTGAATITVTGKVEYRNNIYYGVDGNRLRQLEYALVVNQSSTYQEIPRGAKITGANLQSNTLTDNPRERDFNQTPYQPSIRSSEGFNYGGIETRDLLLVDRQPTGTSGTNSSYTVTLADAAQPVTIDVPLISIRLAPAVDTNTIGLLGQREVINRMQLILNSVGVLTTHACEIELRLNGYIDNIDWSRVTNPSLSQLVYHNPQDKVTGGTTIYSFKAQGSTGTSGRQQIQTTEQLGEVAVLGNSILGGDNIFPDGPDILTVVARLTEDPSSVTGSNPFTVAGRLSWSESQA